MVDDRTTPPKDATKPPEARRGKALPFRASGFFVVRTPLLPFDALLRWAEGTRAATAPTDASVVAADRAMLEERLRELVRQPGVREALFVASPSLDEAIDAWLSDPKSPRGEGAAEICARYLVRMAARPTPFGLFSGCTLGATGGAETRIDVGGEAQLFRHTRLDMHYLTALTEALEREPSLREHLVYRPNTGLYASGGELRYAEGRVHPETRDRSYHLVSIERTDYLDLALARAARGARTGEIAAAIAEADPDVADEAPGFVEQLVESQVLVSDLTPAVTGPEPIEDVLATLARTGGGAEPLAKLTAARDAIAAIDAARLGVPSASYRAIAEGLASFPVKADLARLFQVDLYKRARAATIGDPLLRELERGVVLLARLASPAESDRLRKFREEFAQRYEQREVPLVEALDEERGIGFDGSNATSDPAPLLDELVFPGDANEPRFPFDDRSRWRLRRLHDLLARGEKEWRLDDADLEVLASKEPAELPDAFALFTTIFASSHEAVARGDYKLLLRFADGPSGASLFGRFCLGDDALTEKVAAHLRAEEAWRPDAIFAEIVHLPEGRLGNILCRPVLRAHEIHYVGRGGAHEDKRIPITDLRVSVRGGRIVLRSARLDRVIEPRLCSAHNHPMAELGIYRFLCALGHQDSRVTMRWSWDLLERARFLPRVTYGRYVLDLARWHLDKKELEALGKAGPGGGFAATQALRAARELPRWIGVEDGDNVLPVDLDNALSVDTFVDLVKRRPSALLRELYPAPDELVVEGEHAGVRGRFVHELVVPLERTGELPKPTIAGAARASTLRRRFAPGSEWLYAKLYAGTATVDLALTQIAAPVVERALASGAASSWFFLRYSDPDWHLRLRLRGDPARLAAEVLPALHEAAAPYLEDGRASRLTLDTYEREIERYGGDQGMELVEAIFDADSRAALSIVEALSGDEGNDARWRLALLGTQRLLEDLGLDLDRRIAVLGDIRKGFGREFRAGSTLERQLGAKFRKERLALEELLASQPSPEHPFAPGLDAITLRSERVRPIARELRAREGRGELAGTVDELAGSLVHMHINRMMRADARRQELVLYDFLLRLNESTKARAKKRGGDAS